MGQILEDLADLCVRHHDEHVLGHVAELVTRLGKIIGWLAWIEGNGNNVGKVVGGIVGGKVLVVGERDGHVLIEVLDPWDLLYDEGVDMQLEGVTKWLLQDSVLDEPLDEALALVMGLQLGLLAIQVDMDVVAHDNVEWATSLIRRKLVRMDGLLL